MAYAAAVPVDRGTSATLNLARIQGPPASPGKVAMWLFLATEIMFFTGLIGTYVVLRAGSPPTSYSNMYSPARVPSDYAEHGAKVYKWPVPYDSATNPLSIDLTAANTFILICSSVSMVLGLSGIQRGNVKKLRFWLGVTIVFGTIFLGVQVYEYRQLLFGHHFPIGISKSGHFTPDVSLFASCFFTMTGFHGAHVAGGVVMLTCIWIQSMRGVYTANHHSPVELIGLYWHFVDLVWIILFTVVYLI